MRIRCRACSALEVTDQTRATEVPGETAFRAPLSDGRAAKLTWWPAAAGPAPRLLSQPPPERNSSAHDPEWQAHRDMHSARSALFRFAQHSHYCAVLERADAKLKSKDTAGGGAEGSAATVSSNATSSAQWQEHALQFVLRSHNTERFLRCHRNLLEGDQFWTRWHFYTSETGTPLR